MRTRVKVCCIASVEEARMAVLAGADALGLVGEMPSGPGQLQDAQIREIARSVPPPVTPFLLTMRTDAVAIVEHAMDVGIRTVQIVSHVDAAVHGVLRRAGLQVVQVIHVEDESAIELSCMYGESADVLLLDSGRPGSGELGGTGRVHDWATSARIVQNSRVPVFLAGGLKPENVGEAIRKVRPFGLDLCSGVRRDGRLDLARLDSFMAGLAA